MAQRPDFRPPRVVAQSFWRPVEPFVLHLELLGCSFERNQPPSEQTRGKTERAKNVSSRRGFGNARQHVGKRAKSKQQRLLSYQPPLRCRNALKIKQRVFLGRVQFYSQTRHCCLFTRFTQNPSQIPNFTPSRGTFIADFKTIMASRRI